MSARPFSTRSFLMMTKVTPEGPMFFWAPAKMMPNLLMSRGRARMSEDMSATKGTFPVSGKWGNWVPKMVLFEVM